MMRLMDALALVAASFVTGGIGAMVTIAWLLRRGGRPEAQGQKALLYILACSTAVLAAIVLIFTGVGVT